MKLYDIKRSKHQIKVNFSRERLLLASRFNGAAAMNVRPHLPSPGFE
jgi:hypothetical protein